MIIELILTITAWRKGWGPVALLPMVVGFTVGVLGSGMSNSLVPAAVADLMIYAALITMIVVGRKSSPASPAVSASPTPEITRQTAA
jgi:hypothetical protein